MNDKMSKRTRLGELAQLVERCDRTAEVIGSTPLLSTYTNVLYRILAIALLYK